MTHRLIAYFRDCLLADGGERLISDVFGKEEREQHLFAFSPGQWDPSAPIVLPAAYAERVIALLRSARQERELLVGTYLVTGSAAEAGDRAAVIRAPLLVFNAELMERNGEYAVRAEPESVRVNSVVLDTLGLSPAVDGLDVLHAYRWLENVERRGHVANAGDLPRWRAGQTAYWMATGVVWVTARSQAVRSVAGELDAMDAAPERLSRPLRGILGLPVQQATSGPEPVPEHLPTRLTGAQERTLRNAAAETLSVVTGPPGTGKTYVIACQALDRVLRDERVLIVGSNEHAADVVRDKLGELFGQNQGLLVRAGRGDYRRQLVERLDALLAEAASGERGEPAGQLESKLGEMTRRYRRDGHRFRETLAAAVEEGEHVWKGPGILSGLRLQWLRRNLQERPLLSEGWSTLQKDFASQQQLAQEYLLALAGANLETLLKNQRPQLASLVTALRSNAAGEGKERFKSMDFDVLTRVFPVWVVSAQALHRVLPLAQELFDVVILDEATQCSLPLALPALQRAARAVVVGDPKQLRHVTSISRERQRRLAVRHKVEGTGVDWEYREHSLLDYALNAVAGSQAIASLDEHFRSHPTLIDFNNRRFYGGRLKVLTHFKDIPGRSPLEVEHCGVEVVADVNRAEVGAVLARLTSLIAESREMPDQECPRIGVLAFFQATAMRLERELRRQFDLRTLSRHDLMVGTPHAFQGEERDIMLIATGIYPGRSPAAWTYLNRPDVFNLAMTRARHRQIVFMPKGALECGGSSLLADYLAHVKLDAAKPSAPANVPVDAMRSALIEILESWGARCRVDYPFAGHMLDVLAVYGDHVLAIDTIGCASAAGEAWDWEDYRLLERAGITVFPIGYVDWEERREKVLDHLRQVLGDPGAGTELDGARHFHALRWRLEELGEPELLGYLEALERAYRQSMRWLRLRFAPTELTYARYRQSVEQLEQAAFAELRGAALLLEGLRELSPEDITDTLRNDVQVRVEGSRRATAALNAVAEELALLRTSDSGLQEALGEINRLAARVPSYGVQSEPSDDAGGPAA